jgi:hypothetical protein
VVSKAGRQAHPGEPKIQVLDGRLRYRVDACQVDTLLTPGIPGIVVPEVLHHVEPLGPVRFFVAFYSDGRAR